MGKILLYLCLLSVLSGCSFWEAITEGPSFSTAPSPTYSEVGDTLLMSGRMLSESQTLPEDSIDSIGVSDLSKIYLGQWKAQQFVELDYVGLVQVSGVKTLELDIREDNYAIARSDVFSGLNDIELFLLETLVSSNFQNIDPDSSNLKEGVAATSALYWEATPDPMVFTFILDVKDDPPVNKAYFLSKDEFKFKIESDGTEQVILMRRQ